MAIIVAIIVQDGRREGTVNFRITQVPDEPFKTLRRLRRTKSTSDKRTHKAPRNTDSCRAH